MFKRFYQSQRQKVFFYLLKNDMGQYFLSLCK